MATINGAKTLGLENKIGTIEEGNNDITIIVTPEGEYGESVGEKGIEPEYVVKYVSSSADNEYDSQQQKALDLLTETKEE